MFYANIVIPLPIRNSYNGKKCLYTDITASTLMGFYNVNYSIVKVIQLSSLDKALVRLVNTCSSIIFLSGTRARRASYSLLLYLHTGIIDDSSSGVWNS